MPTSALYHWSVAGSPVNILVDLPLVDRLRVATTSSDVEIGGLLLGHFDGNYTVITEFDPIECEHKRGPAYTLSHRDEQRLGSRIEARRKRGATVVGFFRSHARPGMFLDEGDNTVISSHFNSSSQVVLLVKPCADRTATGGFFFWEEGEMNRKQSYLSFPMNARELEVGDFPLVEPVTAAASATAAPVPDFHNAETMEFIPAPPPVPEVKTNPIAALPEPRRFPTRELETPASAAPRKLPWAAIALIAACAAFGGYLIGTSGGHGDRFGARSGDITLNSAPDPEPAPKPAPSEPKASAASEQAPPVAVAQATPTPAPDVAAPAPEPPKVIAKSPPLPTRGAPLRVAIVPAPAKSITPQSPEENSPGWQHFNQQQPSAPAQVADLPPAPAPVAAPLPPPAPVTESSVTLESVESGSVGRAFSKIPLFGSLHHARAGDSFIPPQAVHSFAPKVPHDLARELTGTLPVDLKLTVDKSGRVSSVEIISHQTPTEFVRLAGDAAYDWRFEPARLKDKPISSDVIAHFRFRPTL